MRRALVPLLLALAAAYLWVGPGISLTGSGPGDGAAPEFPEQHPASWINSPPLTMASLRGQVVLLDVWTFG